ncbi:MAG: 1-deoxy-D-xylulose-5-phosphate synthase [Bacteroidales bacterium]|nr:1-deoxy-D-xylulose-5-phosphate synthase [Bacteroidales bacterium]
MNAPILPHIDSPADIKGLTVEELNTLSAEVRQYIIDTLATHPGHLASSLGTVELTVALHYVFNTPEDKLVWDVGHQAYAHKILTGRRDRFPSIRTYGGLSGFPRMDESPYDAFGTGHSSTSISAALGMAVASALQHDTTRQHIAVIGDGSMTGGEAFEALNNAGVSRANILVILNDNGISIDKAVGGLSRYLTRLSSSPRYNAMKERVWNSLSGADGFSIKKRQRRFFQRLTSTAKTALLGGSNLFESLGFRYFGPIDGHNVEELVGMLERLKTMSGPRLLHVVTKKGKGLPLAEQNPVTYHAPGLYNSKTGCRLTKAQEEERPLTYHEVFGRTIIELAEMNPAIVAITPAMLTGSSLNMMMEQMPHRVFDVGIAEQHAVTFAAGMAAQGLVPFCNIYSSFAQRAYDQIVHDVALQKLHVVFCWDRAGLVGDDGPTHHGVFDLAALRPIPNLTIAAPMDEKELRDMMYTAQQADMGPFAIRYPRGAVVHTVWQTPFERQAVGKGRVIHEGEKLAIVGIGHITNAVIEAAELLREKHRMQVGVVDMRYLKPIDESLLHELFERYDYLLTVEDGAIIGGLGSAVTECYEAWKFAYRHHTVLIRTLGIPDWFITHGSIAQLHAELALDATGIAAAAVQLVGD